MKNITKQMIKIYKPNGICWLGYRITKDNANFHHLIKKENGGEQTINNGAILSEVGHRYLHIIESKEIHLYLAINEVLKIINKQGYAPTEEQYRIINRLLLSFEEEHIKDKTSKNKLLIKYQYLDRVTRYLI